MDEARVGQKGGVTHVWYQKGVRPRGVRLTGADLRGVNLKNAKLANADLRDDDQRSVGALVDLLVGALATG